MPYDRGHQLFNPDLMASGGGLTFAAGLTAHAGGTRAAALPLTAAVNQITVCATAADSVALPPAVGGQEIMVFNSGVAACQVFANPATSDTINGVVAATGISLASSGRAVFVSPGPGIWYSILSA